MQQHHAPKSSVPPWGALGARLRAAGPDHAAILKGMVTVAAFVFIGKLVSAMKEMAVAYRYGTGPEVDAYQLLYTVISWPIGVWSSVLTAVLVPLAMRLRDQQGQLARFRSELLGIAIVAGIALAGLAWVVMHTLFRLGHSGLPARSADLAEAALPGLVLLLPLGMLTALQSAWMLAAGHHLNSLLECIPTLSIATLVMAVPGGGIAPLVWGTVAGAAFHLLSLVTPPARRGELGAPRVALASPHWPWFWQGFGIMLAGQALMSLTVVIDQFYAVGLGTGAIAMLGYANRVLSLILSLAAIAVSRATLPIFSQVQAQGVGRLRAVARRWAGLLFALGVLAAAAGYVAAPWVVRLLFERGRFGAADTAAVAQVLRYGLPQMPFYFASMVLVSYALSQRRYGLVFCSGLIGCAGKIAGNLLLVPPLGVNGIALGTMFVYASNALFFWIALIACAPRQGRAA
jgi:peptidoglycan biosynthesis protein MviN/MurJ (putative lipid II flippase)